MIIMPFVRYKGKKYEIEGKYLDLQSQDIYDITLIEGLENLIHLKALNLRNNQITEIKGLSKLKKLERLYLNRNQIVEIKGLDALQNLQILYLDRNQITEIKGLDALHNLQSLYLDGNQIKDPEEEYLIQRASNAQEFVEYCKSKKIRQNIPFINFNKKLSFNENIDYFRRNLMEITDNSFFVNIGTHKESKKIKGEQNAIFLMNKPNEINLSNKDFNNYKDIIIHLVQLHSLKGIKFIKKNKLEHFNFVISHFWDDYEIEKNNVLLYNDEYGSRVNNKIKEMLDLSVNTKVKMFNANKPDIIIFPENSIPKILINYLKEFSKTNELLIIGGIEHERGKSKFTNKAIIIDKGIMSYQVKQTPVWIWDKENRTYMKENIKCEHLPEINIFNTSFGRIAIFICKDFLRLSEIIPYWVSRNQIDFVIIPSLTTKVLPFQARLLSVLNYPQCINTKFIFNNIGEYGGSELFSVEDNWRIEENYRLNKHDNVGETIVTRKIERIKSKYLDLVSKEMKNCKEDPEKFKKLQVYKKKIESDRIPYTFTKNLSLEWHNGTPHITETIIIKASELFGEKLEGYCIRCKKKIFFNRYKPYCYDDWQDWVRWNNPFYTERYCHKCGEPYGATKSKPFCNNCYWS